MKKENILKKWNLPSEYDEYDISYKYCQNILEEIYKNTKNKIDFLNTDKNILFQKNQNDLITLEKDLEKHTILYLKLKNNKNISINQIKKLNSVQEKIDMYFEIICNALLNARNKIEYIINVQFELIEWFLYACWFLTSFKKSIQIFEKMLEYSFVFPGIDFITQLDACKKSAKKACQEQNNNQNMITTLESIYNHFLFHYYLIEQWKLKYSDLHNSTIDVHELEIKIYEWVLIHYLLPIYICLFGYEENDQTFENLVKQLFEYKFEQNLIEQIINYLIETKYIVKQLDDKNLEILYKNVIKCCNTLVSTNIYLKENNKLKLKVKKMN